MWILSWFHGKNSLVFIPSHFCFDMTKLIGPSSRIMLRNVEQKSKIPVLYQNKSKFAARIFWEWLFEKKVLIGHDQGKFRHFLHIPVLVLDESNWLNVLSPVQTNISAVWTFFPARRPRQWTKKNMLYHIRDGTYEIKDLSSALLCVVSKINEGTRGSKKGGQIIIVFGHTSKATKK